MQYLFSVITDSPELATPDEMASIDTFNERIEAAIDPNALEQRQIREARLGDGR